MGVPGTSIASIAVCLALFIGGFNIFPIGSLPDISSALFMGWLILMLDWLRIHNNCLTHNWMLPIVLIGYYLCSQIVMFIFWTPLWNVLESVLYSIIEKKATHKFYTSYPRLIVFSRRHLLPLFKLATMGYLVFKTSKVYRWPEPKHNEYEFCENDSALKDLLAMAAAAGQMRTVNKARKRRSKRLQY